MLRHAGKLQKSFPIFPAQGMRPRSMAQEQHIYLSRLNDEVTAIFYYVNYGLWRHTNFREQLIKKGFNFCSSCFYHRSFCTLNYRGSNENTSSVDLTLFLYKNSKNFGIYWM